MRIFATIFAALALAACTPRDEQHARERVREAGEKIRREAHQAGREAEADARKLGRELDEDLHKGREKIRKSMGEPSEPNDRRR